MNRTIQAGLALALVAGVVPLAAGPAAAVDWQGPCTVDPSASWLPTGGHLELAIEGCLYRVTTSQDPYVITVTGPASYTRTIYRGDGIAPAGNVVLDALVSGTYTVTSSGVVGKASSSSPAYATGWFSVAVTPASAGIGLVLTTWPAPPAFVLPAVRVAKVTPSKGSTNVSRSPRLTVKYTAQTMGRQDLVITLTDITTGRLVNIWGTHCTITWTTTFYPIARLAANRAYRISVTSVGSNLKFSSTFRTGSW